jgi:hypothetical protein
MAMWPDDKDQGAAIDAAIDEAARQMTDGAPGSDFRARVLARIGEPESSSRGRRLAWVMAPVVALAVIVLLIAVARPATRRSGRPLEPATHQPATESQTTQARTTQPRTTQPPAVVQRTPNATHGVSADRRRTPRAAPSEVETLAPDALDVESIRLAALPSADSIRVAPLETIEPIDAAPLAAPEIDEPQRRQQ